MRTHGSASQLEQVRMIACNMFELDKTSREIADCLGCDDQTIRLWRAHGRDGLRGRTHPSRPPLMNQMQRDPLREMLLASSTCAGGKMAGS